MENNIKKSFSLNITVLKILGVYPSNKYTHLFKLFSYMLYTIAMLPTIVFGFIQFFCNINFLNNDVAGVSMFFLSPKTWFIVKNGHKIKRCIHYFDNEFVTTVNDGHDEIIDKCVKICQRNSLVFFISCIICTLAWFIKLFFRENISELPLDVWNPFKENHRSIFYYCLYVSLALGMFHLFFMYLLLVKQIFRSFLPSIHLCNN
jgi:ABC-type phosphate transport system permease subunit